MIKRKNILYIAGLVCLVNSFNVMGAAYRPAAKVLTYKSLAFESSIDYFSTSAYYNHNGEEVAMESGDSFSKIDLDILGRYGLSRRLEARLSGRLRQNNSVNVDQDISETGIESVAAGLKYELVYSKKRWALALDFQFRQTIYSNEYSATPAKDVMPLGDSGSSLTFGVIANYTPAKRYILEGEIFYNAPSREQSSEILYRFENALVFNKWAILLGIEGITSLKTDGYTNDPTNKPKTGSQSSYMYNSINREIMMPYIGLNFGNFNSFGVEGRLGSVIAGNSTDKGMNLSVNAVWKLKSGKSKKQSKIEKFKEYEFEASVVKVSPRGRYVKIDKGLSNDVEKGMKIDIYQFDYVGGNVLVATGVVFTVGADESIVKIFKVYRSIPVKIGFVARGFE
jgi:hypothetical protein